MPAQKEDSKAKSEISSVFIKEFVRHLIINSKPKSALNAEALERIQRRISEDMPNMKMSIPAVQQARPTALVKSILPSKQNPVQQRRPMQMPPVKRAPLIQSPQMRIGMPQKQAQPIQFSLSSLSKIRPFLQDPSVISVECPGAGKNILLNRSGLTHSAQLSLSGDDISAVLKEFSEKTKIPLIPGVFKAIYDGLLMTAVVSDNVGSRFIVEKQFAPPKLPIQEKK